MSRARGIVPLFLATAIGIGNAIYVFGPALKEQQMLKTEEARKSLEVANKAKEEEMKSLRAAEAAASKTTATESALKSEGSSSSWWSLWARKGSDDKTKTSTGIASTPTKVEEKKDARTK